MLERLCCCYENLGTIPLNHLPLYIDLNTDMTVLLFTAILAFVMGF